MNDNFEFLLKLRYKLESKGKIHTRQDEMAMRKWQREKI